MAKGSVKWFNNTMKYGFILSEEGKEIFVHFSEILSDGYKTLKRGDIVQFEIEESPKGAKAVQVIKIASESKSENKKIHHENKNLRKSA